MVRNKCNLETEHKMTRMEKGLIYICCITLIIFLIIIYNGVKP